MNEREIFLEALEKPTESARSAFLDQACAGDDALRQSVEQLLAAKVQTEGFLEGPPPGLALTVRSDDPEQFDELVGDVPLDFLSPSNKPGCLGTLGPYEVVGLVGRGGFGLVLRAFDTKLNRIVAIKVMSPELATNPTAVKRFLREAQAAAAVRHDHVVTIHAIDEGSRPPFIVMEYVEGQSLKQRIDQKGELELVEILRVGSQIASGLVAAHGQGLVHRDIKPANILLENGIKRVKITDFGLARAVDDVGMTQTGMIAGTPQYMSPEQGLGRPVDVRSDLFSLGSVLYTLCTGRPAFRADSAVATLRRVCDDTPKSLRAVNPEIPEWLELIVMRLLEKSPDDRFQTAEEVSRLLGACLAHVQSAGSATPPGDLVANLQSGRVRARAYGTSLFAVLAELQMAAIVGSLCAALVDIETILFTGFAFGLCLGSAVAYAAIRAGLGRSAFWFGSSSIAFTLLIIVVINAFSLGPHESIPVQVLMALYAVLALPWGYKEIKKAKQGTNLAVSGHWLWKNPSLLYGVLTVQLLGIAGTGMAAVMEIESIVATCLLFGFVFAGVLVILAFTTGKYVETRVFALSAPVFAAVLMTVVAMQDWSVVNNAVFSRLLIARAILGYSVLAIPLGLWAFSKELELFRDNEQSRLQFSMKMVLIAVVIAALAYSGARPCLAFGPDAYFGGILFVMTLLSVALLLGYWFYLRDKETVKRRWATLAVSLLAIQLAFMGLVASYDVATDYGRITVHVSEPVRIIAFHAETGRSSVSMIKRDGQTMRVGPSGELELVVDDRDDLMVVPAKINVDRFNRFEVRVKQRDSTDDVATE